MRRQLWGASVIAVIVAGGAGAQNAPGSTRAVEEVVVTAQKREQKLQKVPQVIQVLDAKKLDQLNIKEFQDYIKYLPSLNQQSSGPNTASVYLRGIADGDNANHSGPLPTVGSYLDEIPTTTIGGNIDLHLYDIARVQVLPGPQGTLYGASSEAGTLQIVTNQPKLGKLEAGYDIQGDWTHGSGGFIGEGFINIPLTDNAAVRLVAYDERDAGYIDNVFGTRVLAYNGVTVNNSPLVKNNFNPVDTFGGRGELRVDLNEDWSVLVTTLGQDTRAPGVFGYEQNVGDLKVQRFLPDSDHDKFAIGALTIKGKIGDYSLTYAGSLFLRDVHTQTDYTDYTVAYENNLSPLYGAYWVGNDGAPLQAPLQYIIGKDHFTKFSNEIRLASPTTDRLRFIVGAFQEEQTHHILQDYLINGFSSFYSIPGWANTIWLTNQLRTDRDYAGFGEVSYDITPQLTATGGVRYYYYDNSLFGFFGYSRNFDRFFGSNTGEGRDEPQLGPRYKSNCLAGQSYSDAPCVNLNADSIGRGETHKINLTYKLDPDRLIYFTYSTGYRPGGANRRADQGLYQSDELVNYELGFKSAWFDHRLTFNAALYYEDWNNFQFSYLGQNSFTIIKNGPSANSKGIELEATAQPTPQLTLTGGLTLTDAQLTKDFCTDFNGVVLNTCISGLYQPGSFAPAGTALPYTPPIKANVTARYNFPFFDWDGHIQGGIVIVGRNQVALRKQDKEGLGSAPAYESVDLLFGIERNRLGIEAFVKNLFDSRGEVNRLTPCTISTCSPRNPVPPGQDFLYAVPITPLTVGIRISQKF